MYRLSPDQILASLEEAGYCALYVGGYVRDRLLGLQAEDADIATSASPDQVVELFRGRAVVKQQGKHFGVVVVDGTEVAMFRGEHYTIPGKPDVFPAPGFEQDAARRDFTINAMGMTRAGEILDPAGGRADLSAGLIRAVGDPGTRFREDPARILRAVTFAARLGFQVEERTAASIRRNATSLKTLPVERVQKELTKMLDRHVLYRGLALLKELELTSYALPELSAVAFQMADDHEWQRVVAAVERAEQIRASCAVVFASIAMGCEESSRCAGQVPAMVLRLGFGRPLTKRVENLVALAQPLEKLSYDPIDVLPWLKQVAAVCRNSDEMKAMVDELWQLQQARDAARPGPKEMSAGGTDAQLRTLIALMLDQVPWYPADASIDGASLGLKGPAAGRKIAELLAKAQAEAVVRLENR